MRKGLPVLERISGRQTSTCDPHRCLQVVLKVQRSRLARIGVLSGFQTSFHPCSGIASSPVCAARRGFASPYARDSPRATCGSHRDFPAEACVPLLEQMLRPTPAPGPAPMRSSNNLPARLDPLRVTARTHSTKHVAVLTIRMLFPHRALLAAHGSDRAPQSLHLSDAGLRDDAIASDRQIEGQSAADGLHGLEQLDQRGVVVMLIG